MHSENKTLILLIAIILIVSFALSLFAYDRVPEQIISHWGANGEPNGYMQKDLGLFLVPLIGVALAIILVIVPKLDPLKKNVQSFIKHYNMIIVVILGFLLYIHALTIIANLGYEIDMGQALSPAFAVLMYFIGALITKTKRNYFIGIRTPWTLESDHVWEKTHEIGGRLFKASGIIALFGIILTEWAIWLIIIPVIFSAIYSVCYSYYIYKKEKKHIKR
jgi:uncharacterized membrane protein